MVQTTGPSCCESLGAAIRGSAMLILIAINFGIALLAWEFGWAREAERKRREAEEAAQRPAAPPPPPRPRRNSTRKHGGRVGPNATRTGRRGRKGSGREASTSSERLVTEPPPGAQGRQECFTVYD